MNSFFCTLPNLQLIALEGEKSAAFLQGQVTCDVREISQNQTRRGAHCSPKGRVLSTFRVLQFNTCFYLLAPAVMSDLVIEQLKKYAVFSKVNLVRDNSLKVMGCAGTEISQTLAALFGDLPTEADQAIAQENLLLIRVQDENTTPRFEIIGTSDSVDKLRSTLQKNHSEKTTELWQLSEINAVIPAIYPTTRDLFTPQMLNYPALNGVSFKKGCYTGQEIIARTHYLGQAKRHLQRLQLTSDLLPLPGDTLHTKEQQAVGIVVDAASLNTATCLVLAVVQDEAMAAALYWQKIILCVCNTSISDNSKNY